MSGLDHLVEAVARAIARATILAAEPDKIAGLSDVGIDAIVENLAVKFFPEARAVIPVVQEQERADVVAYLLERAVEQAEKPGANLPMWRMMLWAVRHPFKFERSHAAMMALSTAMYSIERGEHIAAAIRGEGL